MRVIPVLVKNPIVTFWRLADEIPKICADVKLIFGEKLPFKCKYKPAPFQANAK